MGMAFEVTADDLHVVFSRLGVSMDDDQLEEWMDELDIPAAEYTALSGHHESLDDQTDAAHENLRHQLLLPEHRVRWDTKFCAQQEQTRLEASTPTAPVPPKPRL